MKSSEHREHMFVQDAENEGRWRLSNCDIYTIPSKVRGTLQNNREENVKSKRQEGPWSHLLDRIQPFKLQKHCNHAYLPQI